MSARKQARNHQHIPHMVAEHGHPRDDPSVGTRQRLSLKDTINEVDADENGAIDLPVPRIRKDTGEVTQLIPHDCDELITEWLNFVKGIVGSEHLPLKISHETLHRNKILRVIKKKLVKKCLEMLAEIAELKDNYMESYEQFGKSLKFGIHENSTVRTKVTELLKISDSAPEDEQLDLKEYVDRMKDEHNDKTTDVPVVRRGQVPTIQPVQKTVKVPQVQFLDRMVEQITETQPVSFAEETPKTQTQEKVICCLKENQSEFSEDSTVEQIVDVPVPQIQEETVEVPQIQFIDRAVDVPVFMQRQVPIVRKVQKIEEVPQAQSTDNVMDVPVDMQRQVPAVQVVQKTAEVPQTQSIDRVVNTPIMRQRRVPTVQMAQKTMENPQAQFLDKVVDMPIVVEHQVSTVADAPTTTNAKGRWSQTVIDRVIHGAERYHDKDETNKAKIQAKNGLEDCCVAVRNAATEGRRGFKCETGGKEKTEKVVPDARNWLDKNRLTDEFEAQQKELEEVPADMMTSGQGPVAQNMQKTCENPQAQSISEVIDVSEVKQRRVSTGIQTDRTVEVPRVIPQERILKPAGERASVRERVRQFERNGGASCSNNVEVPRTNPDDRQSEDPEDEAPLKRRKQESDPDSAELETRPRGVPVGQLDDVLLEVRDVKSELLQVRELVGVLVRRERCAEVKTEVAARRLDRMEREKDDADDAEREANLEHGPVQSREVDRRQVVRRQRLRFRQDDSRRSRLHPRQRRAWRRGAHGRH